MSEVASGRGRCTEQCLEGELILHFLSPSLPVTSPSGGDRDSLEGGWRPGEGEGTGTGPQRLVSHTVCYCVLTLGVTVGHELVSSRALPAGVLGPPFGRDALGALADQECGRLETLPTSDCPGIAKQDV